MEMASLSPPASVEIYPSRGPATGRVVVPGSKSLSNRYILLAAVARGESRLQNVLDADDTRHGLALAEHIGAIVRQRGDWLHVTGTAGAIPSITADLHVGSAGTLGRFLPGIIAAAAGARVQIVASAQLAARPVHGLIEPLRALGARIHLAQPPSSFPMIVDAAGIEGGEAFVEGDTSSQFVSGVLLCSPLARNAVTLRTRGPIVQPDYVTLTIKAMRAFGADVAEVEDGWIIQPTGYEGASVEIEADASTASYFAALAAVTGGDVVICNLDPRTQQPDILFLNVLEQMGCRVNWSGRGVRIIGPPRLSGGFDIDFSAMSDTALTLAAIAPFAEAPIRITGVEHIRRHESDRVAAMASELSRAGVAIEELQDGWAIKPSHPRREVHETYDDHRMAMALTVLGCRAGAVLRQPACVAKTCPRFFDLIAELGIVTATLQ